MFPHDNCPHNPAPFTTVHDVGSLTFYHLWMLASDWPAIDHHVTPVLFKPELEMGPFSSLASISNANLVTPVLLVNVWKQQ